MRAGRWTPGSGCSPSRSTSRRYLRVEARANQRGQHRRRRHPGPAGGRVPSATTPDLFATPALGGRRRWRMLEQLMRLRVERRILDEQHRLLAEELRMTSQRVNLFEKVKIPECRREHPGHPHFPGRPADRRRGPRQDRQGPLRGKGESGMIVRMKKVTLLCTRRPRDAALDALRRTRRAAPRAVTCRRRRARTSTRRATRLAARAARAGGPAARHAAARLRARPPDEVVEDIWD